MLIVLIIFYIFQDDYLDGPYEYNPVDNEYGSSRFYNSRKQVTSLNTLTYEEAMTKYGETLVVVASIEDRWHALAPHMPITYLYQMMPINYCLLELIGKSRDNVGIFGFYFYLLT